MKKNILKNSDGILTVDYLFAIVLAMGFMVILFSLSMTLTMVDVVQYMTFSSARVYSVANVNEAKSIENAKEKFSQLYTDPRVRSMFDKTKWFVLSEPEYGDLTNIYQPTNPSRNTFYGVSVGMNAKMLDIKIPFYGSTSTKNDGQGFSTNIHTFLGREPSTEECQIFSGKRLEWLINERGYNHPDLRNNLQNYKNITDNGC